MKQAVILAGGKGTRLGEVLADLPKPLIDVCGKPLLERQLDLLESSGFEEVLVLVNHKGKMIAEFCDKRHSNALRITCIDDGEPLGTAGSVLKVLDQLKDDFLVVYGDTMLQVDLKRFWEHHKVEGDHVATLFLHPNDHPHDSDIIECDELNIVTQIYPYPHSTEKLLPNLVNAALYWINRSALKFWGETFQGACDFGKHLFPKIINSGGRLRGYKSFEYIKDCGTPKRIQAVRRDFESGKINRARRDAPQRVIFCDRDGTINEEVGHLNHPDLFEILPNVGPAIRRLNQSEYRVCVTTNQPVLARGDCSYDTLRQIHCKLETLLGKDGAFLDAIYCCPHHPESGFVGEVTHLKIDCTCRKPKLGLIEIAERHMVLDRTYSWVVGDSSADILMAQRAGLSSILVKTGHGGLDGKYVATPDYTVSDFACAVDLVLDAHPAGLAAVNIALQQQPREISVLVCLNATVEGPERYIPSVIFREFQKRGYECTHLPHCGPGQGEFPFHRLEDATHMALITNCGHDSRSRQADANLGFRIGWSEKRELTCFPMHPREVACALNRFKPDI